jgi:membrane associated rhomboid family serine protease
MKSRTGYLASACLLLALFGYLAMRSSLAGTVIELTTGERAVRTLQWWYAVLGAIAILGLIVRHNGTRLVLFAWAAIFITRNALAPVYVGGQGVGMAVAGAAVGLAIAVGVLVLGFRALQPPADAPTT